MRGQSLLEMVEKALDAEDLKLPVFNQTAIKLQRALGEEDFSIEKCTALINRDQALASKILKEANSSFYGGLSKVVTINDALVRLGSKEVLRLTMQVSQRGLYRCRNKGLNQWMEKLWRHSLGCALGAYWLAKNAGYQALMQEAFLGGLMHDIGQLFLLKVLDDICRDQPQTELSEALVTEVLVGMHVEQGFRLMQHWGLPEEYVSIVHYHHHDDPPVESPLLTLVMLADQACRKLGIAMVHHPDLVLATSREAQLLGLKETTLAELEIVLEDKFLADDQAVAN